MREELLVESNVRISVLDLHGKLVDRRESHNVLTNNGAAWLARLASSANYLVATPAPNTTERVKYIGLGCGGVLQTDAGALGLLTSQSALITVTALEDPVPYSGAGGARVWLKQVDDQAVTPTYFPTSTRVKFIVDLLPSEVSYAGSTTGGGAGTAVGTLAPISEAGLYLSSADTAILDPTQENGLVAYDVFAPISITANNKVRVEWELRFR
jgi:hypothetical protein